MAEGSKNRNKVDRLVRQMRRFEHDERRAAAIGSTAACVAGDTSVAMADGREKRAGGLVTGDEIAVKP